MNKQTQKRKSQAYQHLRNLTRGCTLETRDSWLAYVKEDGTPVYDMVTKDVLGIKRGKDFFGVAKHLTRKWQVKIRVWCVADDGVEYVEETELIADNVKLDDLNSVYQEHKAATRDACNPRHIRDIGWIAKALT